MKGKSNIQLLEDRLRVLQTTIISESLNNKLQLPSFSQLLEIEYILSRVPFYFQPTNGDLYTLEANLVSKSLRELTDGADKDPITKLRLLCLSRGATGILGLGR